MLNRDCVIDEYYDSDPIYGFSGRTCETNASAIKIFANAFGLYIFGYISKYILKGDEEEKNEI
jgi:hypothetical protein